MLTARYEGPVVEGDTPPACVRQEPDVSTVGDFLHDESKMSAPRIASLAIPTSVEELRAVLRWHALNGHAIVAQGSRTGVAGGGVPDESGRSHVISVSTLRGITSANLEGETPTVTVLAGTWLSELMRWLSEEHPKFYFPVDPTETSASLGGMVATNAGGARSYRFGSMRSWVEGITIELASGNTLRLRRGVDVANGREVALKDGEEFRTLSIASIPKPATKNAIGYGFSEGGDVLDLFVGAEGTLGIISDVTLRLARSGERRMGMLQFFPDAVSAFRFVDALRGAPALRTTAIEFQDARSHALARESGKPAVDRVLGIAPNDSCSVFAEIAYGDDEELVVIAESLESLISAAGGDPAASIGGASEDELRDIRIFRHAIPERANAIIARRREEHPGLHKIATDMSVADRDLPWVYELYRTRLTEAGLDFVVFGHVGNNHFHVNILPRDERELARAKEIYAGFARDVVARGGSVAAEHGIGRIKKSFLATQYSSETLQSFREIKAWADPGWRLNRGVLIDP